MARYLRSQKRQPSLDFTVEAGETADKLSLSKNLSYLLICVEKPPEHAAAGDYVDLWTTIATNFSPDTAREVLQLAQVAIKNRGSGEFRWTQSKAGGLLASSLELRNKRDDGDDRPN